MKLPHRRQFLHLAAGAAALPAVSRTAWAQAYPTRPITIVDTFAPGGSTGIIARILADRLSQTLGQQVVVDQRPGAGGTVGARQVARSAPDGYTLMLGFTSNLATGPSLYPNVGYDPRKDFSPIGLIGTAPYSLVAHPSFEANSIVKLIEYAKKNPGKVNYGNPGVGTGGHIAGELLASMTSIKLGNIPYRGSGPMLADLIGGHIPIGFAPIPVTYESTKNGTLRMLGITSVSRSRLLPELPTIAEQGVPGYDAVLRYGLVAPAGTPRSIIDRLNKELNAALAHDEVRARFATLGTEMLTSTPEEHGADIAREVTKWSTLIGTLGIKGE
jgi:tripartite-type tricarboxylate transporter receptor subunit TctC